MTNRVRPRRRGSEGQSPGPSWTSFLGTPSRSRGLGPCGWPPQRRPLSPPAQRPSSGAAVTSSLVPRCFEKSKESCRLLYGKRKGADTTPRHLGALPPGSPRTERESLCPSTRDRSQQHCAGVPLGGAASTACSGAAHRPRLQPGSSTRAVTDASAAPHLPQPLFFCTWGLYRGL